MIIAWLLLGAHFLRSGNLMLAIVCALVPLLLLIKKQWSLLLLQLLTYAGVVSWLGTAITIARQRIWLGDSWGKSVIILLGVALFTASAGLLLNSSVVKKRFFS